jgi:hypothetical protein
MTDSITNEQLDWLSQELRCQINRTRHHRPIYRMSPWEPYNSTRDYAIEHGPDYDTIYEVKLASSEMAHMIRTLQQQEKLDHMMHKHANVREAYMNLRTLMALMGDDLC